MADVWDVARYVESHPDDTDQRWRLAKKLYMAWEFRIASSAHAGTPNRDSISIQGDVRIDRLASASEVTP